MANVVGDIAISVGADIGPLVRDLSKASSAVSKFGADAGKSGGGMSVLAKGAGIFAASVVTASVAMAAFTKRAMDNIDALSKQARVAGVSVATFQAMAQVAEEAGVSAEQLSKTLVKMQDNITNLGKGGKQQVEAFDALGVSFSRLDGLKADEQFAIIAEKIDAIQDPAAKTSAAIDVFGKSGADAINMLGGFRAAVQDAAKFQRDFGLAVSDVDARNIEAANDAMGRVKMAVGGLATEMAVAFAPAVEMVALGLAGLVHDLIGTKTAMEETFQTAQIAKSILGEELYAALQANAKLFAENAQEVGKYKGTLQALSDYARDAAISFYVLSKQFQAAGETGLAAEMEQVGRNVIAARDSFDNGSISAEEFRQKIQDAAEEAARLMDAAQGVDGLNLSNAKGQIAGLTALLKLAKTAADNLRGALPSVNNSGPDERGSQRDAYASSTLAPGTSPRPPRAPQNVDFGIADAGSGGGGGGGGGGDNGADDLKRMQDKFATEQEQIQAQYAEQLAKLEEFRQSKLLTEQEYNDLEAKVKEEHQKKLADIEQASRSARLDAYAGALGDLASLMQSSNSKLFKVGQAAAIAQSIVSGYQAAVDAWQKGMKIGGPPVAAAFTAASLVKTGAMIAKIKSQSPTGGGSTTNVGGGASAPATPQSYANITLNGDTFSRASLEDLFKQINSGLKQGRVINLVTA